jgi:cell division protein FtsB
VQQNSFFSHKNNYSQYLTSISAFLKGMHIPKYALIMILLIAMVLLASASIYRERESVKSAQQSLITVQNKFETEQNNKLLLQREIKESKQNKEVITRIAQSRLGYVKPNEIVLHIQ